MAMNPRLLRPTPTGFNPRRIAGLAGWWDFSDAATLGSAATGPGGVSNNGPIKYAGDKSGNGRHMVQSGADSAAPTFLTAGQNGRTVAGFDGGDSMTLDSTITLTGQTVFAVARLTSAASDTCRLFSQSDAGNDFNTTGHYIPLTRNGSTAAIASYATGAIRSSVAVTYDEWFLVSSRHTGSQIQNSINGSAGAAFSHTLNKEFTRFALGDSQPSFAVRWRDRMAEILFFSRSLSDAEMNKVARWLGTKWGIAVS
jgi:hypothetical protein